MLDFLIKSLLLLVVGLATELVVLLLAQAVGRACALSARRLRLRRTSFVAWSPRPHPE
jgi:hypothetical protein